MHGGSGRELKGDAQWVKYKGATWTIPGSEVRCLNDAAKMRLSEREPEDMVVEL